MRRGSIFFSCVCVIVLTFGLGGWAVASGNTQPSTVWSPEGYANLRSEPGCSAGEVTGCGVLGQVASGDTLVMNCWIEGSPPYGPDSSSKWFKVYSPTLQQEGWIWSDYVDPATQASVPSCLDTDESDQVAPSPVAAVPSSTPSVQLAQGDAAASGYRYSILVTGLSPEQVVTVECYDSVDSATPFYQFDLSATSDGTAATDSQCYSGDGPDHWVSVNGLQSNLASW